MMKKKTTSISTATSKLNPDQSYVILFYHSGKETSVRRGKSENPVSVPWKTDKVNSGNGCQSKDQKTTCTPKQKGGCCGSREDGEEEVRGAKHSRRLVVHQGRFVDKDGKIVSGELAFWTEWEACTIAERMPKGSQETDARWFHRVVSPLGKSGKHRINTDPCVFGSTFKYALCQQHRRGEKRSDSVVLRRLTRGSLILFGSLFQKRNEIVLDTVFVVGEKRINYVERTKRTKLDVSPEYRELTLNRFSNEDIENTFYRGESFEVSHNTKPYSFVPAKPFVHGDSRCGKRFVLNVNRVFQALQRTHRSFLFSKTQGYQKFEVPADIAKLVWNEILRQVREQGFVPGFQFDWPK